MPQDSFEILNFASKPWNLMQSIRTSTLVSSWRRSHAVTHNLEATYQTTFTIAYFFYLSRSYTTSLDLLMK